VLIHESVLPLDRSSPPAEAPADRLNSANEPTDHAAVSRAEKSRTECEFAARHAIVMNACSSWSPHTPSSACPRRKSAQRRCAVIRRPHPQAEAERLMRIGQVCDRSCQRIASSPASVPSEARGTTRTAAKLHSRPRHRAFRTAPAEGCNCQEQAGHRPPHYRSASSAGVILGRAQHHQSVREIAITPVKTTSPLCTHATHPVARGEREPSPASAPLCYVWEASSPTEAETTANKDSAHGPRSPRTN